MRSLTLLSGGIDSAVCLAMMRHTEREAIGFDYGQEHRIELTYAAELAALEGVTFHSCAIPAIGKIDDVVFAGRNAVLITLAASYAAARGIDAVVVGANASDWHRFPDCRPEFMRHMRKALFAYGVDLWAPLLHSCKSEVVAKGHELGVPIDRTWSCYTPRGLSPCGVCVACNVRAAAL